MSTYIRLTDYKDSDSKEQGFFKSENRYEAKQSDFEKIPGSPIAYWVSDRVKEIFEKSEKLEKIAKPRQGMATTNNDLFLRLWNEIDFLKLGLNFENEQDTENSFHKWFPYNKGGEFRKWFGNAEYTVNYQNKGNDVKNYIDNKIGERVGSKGRIINREHYFKEGITWSFVSSSNFGVRYTPKGFIFDIGGSSAFPESNNLLYITSFLTSKIAFEMLKIVAPTINFQVGDLNSLPLIFPYNETIRQLINDLTQQNINISREDWNSRETSWDFTKNELLKHKSDSKIETAYNNYCSYWKEKFYQLHSNEEELNKLFIDIYELQDELTPNVALKDITILKSESIINDHNELEFKSDEIMKQFISYAVGVMFGRYSLDSDGLVVANLNQDYPKVTTFEIDDDNVIPVLEDDYFSDDIASRIINFVKATFGAENLTSNINFIEKCLGKTIRAYMVKDFYEDHIKRYKKRPIYWMVSSPKKGFMSLSYMHRYTTDLFARVQNNYLREYITKLEATIENLERIANDDSNSTAQRTKASKDIVNSNKKLEEIIKFDREKLTAFAQNAVDIDLDDGVKINYLKFKDVLYEIKGLDK